MNSTKSSKKLAFKLFFLQCIGMHPMNWFWLLRGKQAISHNLLDFRLTASACLFPVFRSFKCIQLQPPSTNLKPCLYVWSQFEDHSFRLYQSNWLSKMADRLVGVNCLKLILRKCTELIIQYFQSSSSVF